VKKVITLLTAVLLGAAACSSSSGAGKPTGPVDITLWHGQSDTAGTSIEKLVAEFNRTHPGIKVKTDSGGTTSDNMLPKVTAGLAAGTYPDIAYVYGSWAANIAHSPKALDLSKYTSAPAVNWNDFWPNTRQTATVDGKIIGFPAATDNLVVLYNKKLLKADGVATPSPTWSWDDFRADAKKLTNPGKQIFGTTWPISGGEETTWQLWPLLWQNGGKILSADGKKAAFDSPAGVQALTVAQQMAVQDKSVYLDSSPGDKGEKLFESGRMGLYLAGPWVLQDVENAKIDYGVAVLPGTNGDHETISGPDNWVVLDHGSRREQASVTFLTWLTAPQQQLTWMMDTGSLPTRKSIENLPGYAAYVKKYPGIDLITNNLSNAHQIRPVSTKYSRLSSFVAQAITSVLLGKSSPSSALSSAANQSNAILGVPGS
jgi:multiple sugar transport system substrate-binding protein